MAAPVLLFSNLEQRLCCLLPSGQKHLCEVALGVSDLSIILCVVDKELERVVVLNAKAFVHDEDAICVDHSCKSMGDQDHCASLELRPELLLEYIVSFQVNVGSGFVENEHLGVLKDSTCQADELLLSNREEVVTLRHDRFKSIVHLVNVIQQAHFFEYVSDLLICLLMEWINVVSDGTLEEEWRLWNIGDALSQHVQANVFDVVTVDDDLAFRQLTKSEQSLENGGLTSTCSSNDADLHIGLDNEVKFFDTGLKTLSVSHGYVVEFNFSLIRPLRFFEFFVSWFVDVVLALQLCVLHDPLG